MTQDAIASEPRALSQQQAADAMREESRLARQNELEAMLASDRRIHLKKEESASSGDVVFRLSYRGRNNEQTLKSHFLRDIIEGDLAQAFPDARIEAVKGGGFSVTAASDSDAVKFLSEIAEQKARIKKLAKTNPSEAIAGRA